MSDHLTTVPNLSVLQTHRSEKWRGFAKDVLPLPVAEMDFPVAEPIRAILTELVANSDLGYLGPIPELGLGFKKFAQERWNWELDESQVRAATDVGVAVVEILRVMTQPGDSILINSPVYHNFYNWINETKLNKVDVPFQRTGDEAANPWDIDWAGIENAYASGIKVHLLCSPHNPLGRIYSKEELLKFVGLAQKHNVLIISNELHAPLTYTGKQYTPILSLGENAQKVSIVVSAASKGWNIAGLKCAIIVTQDPVLFARLNEMPLAVHYRSSILGAFATSVAFSDCGDWLDDVVSQLDENRYLIKNLLSAKLPSVRYHIPDNGYLAWLDLESLKLGVDPSKVLLEKGRVAFNPGHTFGPQCSQYIRLNFATSPVIVSEAIERIARTV
jgi:cystathionine beta-lyase